MAILDVVKWDGDPHTLAYKHPDCELTNKSQLIVAESQEAVLVKEGQFFGPFKPGRHVLDTKNYPFLTPLMKAFIIKSSPFTAEVWFVQKAIPIDNKWGTMDPLWLEDPQYHIALPVRGYGQYGIQIVNSMKFLSKVVGRLTTFDTISMSEYFRGIIVTRVKDCISTYLTDKNVSILQISSHLNEISEFIQNQISEDVDAYGAAVTSFVVNSINPDQNDPAFTKLKDALAKKAEMDIIGYTYHQERTFDTMHAAAGNTGSGGMINAGIGLGVGVGMAAPVNQMMSNMTQNLVPPPPPAAAAAAGEAQIICSKCKQQLAADSKFCNRCGKTIYRCPECGQDNAENASVCGSCGKPMPRKCPKCGELTPGGVKFCSNCGNPMVKSCPACGKVLESAGKFCPECGSKIE